MEVRQMLETVPQTPAAIERLKAAAASMRIHINSLVSPDGRLARSLPRQKGLARRRSGKTDMKEAACDSPERRGTL
jgi:hypothetical protein